MISIFIEFSRIFIIFTLNQSDFMTNSLGNDSDL